LNCAADERLTARVPKCNAKSATQGWPIRNRHAPAAFIDRAAERRADMRVPENLRPAEFLDANQEAFAEDSL
jgi:hypothetical protein